MFENVAEMTVAEQVAVARAAKYRTDNKSVTRTLERIFDAIVAEEQSGALFTALMGQNTRTYHLKAFAPDGVQTFPNSYTQLAIDDSNHPEWAAFELFRANVKMKFGLDVVFASNFDTSAETLTVKLPPKVLERAQGFTPELLADRISQLPGRAG